MAKIRESVKAGIRRGGVGLEWIGKLHAGHWLILGVALLLLATQLVIAVIDYLEKRRFGSVYLGTLITPLCTGFPNLMIGLFGQERLRGDLVLQLNLGNNIANTSLVTGLILFAAGPLLVRPAKGKSKKARQANQDQWIALTFLWCCAAATFWLAHDGRVDRSDGLLLTAAFFVFHFINMKRRKPAPKKQRLGWKGRLGVLAALGLAAWLIQISVGWIGNALDEAGTWVPGWHLGLFLGLLTVIPESFLLLRLAIRGGSLGFSGLIGDCLVSVPLVIGLSAIFYPFDTAAVPSITARAAWPYLHLGATMLAFTFLSLKKRPASRKLGLLFILLYAMVWWHSR